MITALAQGKVNKQAEDASYRAYRILIHGIFVMGETNEDQRSHPKQ